MPFEEQTKSAGPQVSTMGSQASQQTMDRVRTPSPRARDRRPRAGSEHSIQSGASGAQAQAGENDPNYLVQILCEGSMHSTQGGSMQMGARLSNAKVEWYALNDATEEKDAGKPGNSNADLESSLGVQHEDIDQIYAANWRNVHNLDEEQNVDEESRAGVEDTPMHRKEKCKDDLRGEEQTESENPRPQASVTDQRTFGSVQVPQASKQVEEQAVSATPKPQANDSGPQASVQFEEQTESATPRPQSSFSTPGPHASMQTEEENESVAASTQANLSAGKQVEATTITPSEAISMRDEDLCGVCLNGKHSPEETLKALATRKESRAKRQSSELFFTCTGCCGCFQGDTVDYVARTICGLCAKSNYEKSMITFDNGTPVSQDFVALAGYAACELEENSIHDFRCIPCSEKEGQTDLGLIDNPAGEGVMIICRCQKSNGGKARHQPKRPSKKE